MFCCVRDAVALRGAQERAPQGDGILALDFIYLSR
jgi:hypothetical protein